MSTSTTSSSSSSSSSRLAATLVAGAALRLALAASPLPNLLLHRNELVTPLTSWTRLQEGYHLSSTLHQNPYSGGSFHHAPLLLLLGPLSSPNSSPWFSHLVWTTTEVGTAWLVARIADKRKRTLLDGRKEVRWEGWWVAVLYLFHPFSIGTSLARSTIVFSNFFVALAISSALEGSLLSLSFSLSIATHLSLYPSLLLPPLTLLTITSTSSTTTNRKRTNLLTVVGAFLAHQTTILLLSNWMTGTWEFLQSVYGVILTLPDLTPTIGLGWYFFIEMFDHFRSFFVGVFQLHVLIYVAPLTFAYRNDSLFTVVLLTGIIAIFKSYPALGDFALWHALLATYSELGAYLERPFLLVCLTLYSLFLLPTFHHLWLYSGSGNANFFYASTLVWTVSQGGLLLDFLSARGMRDVVLGLGQDGRKKVWDGKWKIMQR